jgi:hypothetical protein
VLNHLFLSKKTTLDLELCAFFSLILFSLFFFFSFYVLLLLRWCWVGRVETSMGKLSFYVCVRYGCFCSFLFFSFVTRKLGAWLTGNGLLAIQLFFPVKSLAEEETLINFPLLKSKISEREKNRLKKQTKNQMANHPHQGELQQRKRYPKQTVLRIIAQQQNEQ